jgi:hypothetical protein
MRDQYAGDVSDYLKFAFLRSIVTAGGGLGVGWYYLPRHDGRADGKHLEYLLDDGWRALDPDLFDVFGAFEHRSVSGLEDLGIWPGPTRFHRAPVEARRRQGWAAQMLRDLEETSLVFVDPDNGVSLNGRVHSKSVTLEELAGLARRARPVVLIRFPDRTCKHEEQLARLHGALAGYSPLTLRTTVRVPNRSGTTTPRIRWFTVLNPTEAIGEGVTGYCERLSGLPNLARCEITSEGTPGF